MRFSKQQPLLEKRQGLTFKATVGGMLIKEFIPIN